jgi:UDPglucose 6-dehydrogenase
MKICVIGTGYVGLVAGTCLAEMGNNVICVDNNLDKIKSLRQGVIPIYEPGLEELIKVNISEGRLSFTDNLDKAVKDSTVCMIAVGTPEREDGSADLSYVFNVAKEIAANMNDYKVIVNKSTVPVGTADKVAEIIRANTNYEFDVVSNPEFLKQGAAVDDFLKPDRVIIGSDSQRATEIIQEIYSPFLRTGNPIIVMDVKSAEMSKYAANAFLATKISFINEIANICEKVGADSEFVRIGMSSDSRIGSQFLFPGLGYGGSCFPKDVKALKSIADEYNISSKILTAVDYVNQNQREVFINKIFDYYEGDLSGKTFALWGLAFKPRTNDMREAPAITIIKKLLKAGAKIKAFDPKAAEEAKNIFGDSIEYIKSSYEALEGADALVLVTEWNEFRRPDFEKIKSTLKDPVIFDGRNQYDTKRLADRGIDYICIGKQPSLKNKRTVVKK